MAEISKTQRQTLGAMYVLEVEANSADWQTRYDIGCKVFGGRGVNQSTMRVLAERGLVEHESDDVLRLVRDGVCRCGCDRWRLTLAGRKMMDGKRIVVGKSWED